MQRNPRGQTCSQTVKFVRPLSAKAEGSVELLVDGFHNLADARRPTPQPLGPTPFASVAFGRADDPHPVTIEPSSVVILTLAKPLSTTFGPEAADPALPSLGSGPQGEEGLKANGWSLVEAEAKPKPVITPVGSTATCRRKPSYQPRLLDQPTSA